ncbi:Protein transport protein sec22 [Mycena sanguinolenta]|uniref:Protein transport protein sec22 n=1 Tax=Mycena sanguinolenta TaxID=230812 RepID=A0A8H6XWV9_9AGAR|nr:Protein transport protein sec22 [Mycena sanguinolenta]
MASARTVCGTEGETLQGLWDDAFDVYKHRTGIDLRHENSDFALRLRDCDSAASVLDTLHDTASRFSGHREGSPKWSKFRRKLKPVITVIALFIDAAAEGAASASVPGGKAVFVAFGVLLKATQGVSEKFDALIDLLESLELFFRQLSIRSDVPLGKESRSIVVEILVEMLKALALATQMMKQNRIKHFVRELFKGDDMKAILDRLQKLTTIESRMTVVEILGMVNQAGGVLGDVNRATSSLQRQNLDILTHLSMLPVNLEQQMASIMEKNMQRISEEISVSITQKHASASSVGPRTRLSPSNTYLDLFYRTIRALITLSSSEQATIRRDMAALLPVVTTTRLTEMEGSSLALSSLAAAINPTTAIGLYTQTIVLYIVAYMMWRLISKVTSAIPSAPDFDIRNTIVLIDLVGVEVRLPLERCATFENFHRFLMERFSNQRIAKYVLSRAYEVTDVANSAIVYPHVWERRIRAGMKLDMAVLLYRPFSACPWCGLENKVALWIYCECGRTYQASAASLTEPQDTSARHPTAFIEELEPEASSSGSDNETPEPGEEDEDDVEDGYEDGMASLRKVHVIFDDSDPTIPGAVPAGYPPLLAAPEGFSRPINTAQAFIPFKKIKVQDMDSIVDNLPRMPVVLLPHDVFPSDWNRMMQDLCLAWTGRLPATGRPQVKPRLTAELINLWNISFFLRRGIEVVLYKGRERRTGPSTGVVDIQLYDEDEESTSLSSSSEDSDSDSVQQQAFISGQGSMAQVIELRNRRRELRAEKKRRRKEKQARRKQRAREKTFALYLTCVPTGSAATRGHGGPPAAGYGASGSVSRGMGMGAAGMPNPVGYLAMENMIPPNYGAVAGGMPMPN